MGESFEDLTSMRSLPMHRDKYASQNGWREISNILEVAVEACKNKQVRGRYVLRHFADGVFCPAVIRLWSWHTIYGAAVTLSADILALTIS